MKRRKFITLTTEQDIETACKWMDQRERDALQEDGGYEIAESDEYERAVMFQAHAVHFDDGWR